MKYTIDKIAYFAGILDGEGTISMDDKRIGKSKSRGIRKSFRPYKGKIRIYRARVVFGCHLSICNTDPRIMNWLVQNFGGAISVSKRMHAHWAIKLTWFASCKSICEILEACLPYLILKKDQAILMIEARKNIDANIKREEYPDEIYNRHLEICHLIRSYNKKNLPPCCPSALSSEEFQVNYQ